MRARSTTECDQVVAATLLMFPGRADRRSAQQPGERCLFIREHPVLAPALFRKSRGPSAEASESAVGARRSCPLPNTKD